MTTKTAGRKKPRAVAVIDADRCTGCRACIEVCPVDCIALVATHAAQPAWQAVCEIDAQRCTGCQWCVRLPRKRGGNPAYTLRVCPWDAIAMVATAEAACASASSQQESGTSRHSERSEESGISADAPSLRSG